MPDKPTRCPLPGCGAPLHQSYADTAAVVVWHDGETATGYRWYRCAGEGHRVIVVDPRPAARGQA